MIQWVFSFLDCLRLTARLTRVQGSGSYPQVDDAIRAVRHGVRHGRVDVEIFSHLDPGKSRDLAAEKSGLLAIARAIEDRPSARCAASPQSAESAAGPAIRIPSACRSSCRAAGSPACASSVRWGVAGDHRGSGAGAAAPRRSRPSARQSPHARPAWPARRQSGSAWFRVLAPRTERLILIIPTPPRVMQTPPCQGCQVRGEVFRGARVIDLCTKNKLGCAHPSLDEIEVVICISLGLSGVLC